MIISVNTYNCWAISYTLQRNLRNEERTLITTRVSHLLLDNVPSLVCWSLGEGVTDVLFSSTSVLTKQRLTTWNIQAHVASQCCFKNNNNNKSTLSNISHATNEQRCNTHTQVKVGCFITTFFAWEKKIQQRATHNLIFPNQEYHQLLTHLCYNLCSRLQYSSIEQE